MVKKSQTLLNVWLFYYLEHLLQLEHVVDFLKMTFVHT